MNICDKCIKQADKGRYADPHSDLLTIGERRVFRGGMTGGYEEQDYKCKACGAEFTHSNGKNDFGWMLQKS